MGEGHLKPSSFGRWLNPSLAFSAPAMASLQLPFSACDAVAVTSNCQLRCWREAGAC